MVVKNYSGDVMNFDMAKDMAEMDDISIKSIVVENSLYTQGRRGVAQNGTTLDEIDKIAHDVLPNIKTIAVALSAATVPEIGKPGFELAEG